MALSRYNRDRYIKGGKQRATATTIRIIRQMMIDGTIPFTTYVCKENERLDHLAARFLGDSRDWWVLAATSGIGWGLQVPPGTRIVVPRSMQTIRRIAG
jgi:hypothetical protein